MTTSATHLTSDSWAAEDPGYRLESVALLDARYRLREDPGRRRDLDATHARLREMLRNSADPHQPES
jgi:hypothetical protein